MYIHYYLFDSFYYIFYLKAFLFPYLHFHIDAACDVKQQQASINAFNFKDPSSNVRVLLALIKACAEGIYLVGELRVVLLDIVWNPSVEK